MLAFISGSSGLVLGGSWVVISRVISRVIIITTHFRGLIAPLITTHEPYAGLWGSAGGLRV